ncbi:hypothetical protein [Thiolapillus sp.]|uniref:hypothetical protein n=1 Tax=Thiolapillus sp. TaxID=2017437 RepID=UPI003AF67F88
MISRTQESTDELPRTYVGTSVYTAHTTYLQIQTPINISLIKEQTEHNIGEVCINSLGWYDANTVKNKIIIIIKAYYEIS